MGHIKKIGDTYFIEFYARGLLYSQVAGSDEVSAKKLLEDVEKKIASGEMLTVVRQMSVVAFFDDFIQTSKNDQSLISLQRFIRLTQDFTEFLTTMYPSIINISEVTPIVVENYKKVLINRVKPHVVTFSILLLREIMEHGIKIGFLNDNPTIHVTLMRRSERTYKPTSRFTMAQQLLGKSVSLNKVIKLLKLTDVARIMFFSNLIPLKREEMYNDAF